MPHGYSDSEWAKMGCKSLTEVNEKIERERKERDSKVEIGTPGPIPGFEMSDEKPVEPEPIKTVSPIKKKKGGKN